MPLRADFSFGCVINRADLDYFSSTGSGFEGKFRFMNKPTMHLPLKPSGINAMIKEQNTLGIIFEVCKLLRALKMKWQTRQGFKEL